MEGCNIPPYISAEIKPRSSLVNSYCNAISGIYDAGFSTEHIGGLLMVHNPHGFGTEEGASIAKFTFYTSNPIRRPYNKKRTKSNSGRIEEEGRDVKIEKQHSIFDFPK